MELFHYFILLVIFIFLCSTHVTCMRVNIAAILPEDNSRVFSLPRVSPAIEYAIDTLRTSLLRGHSIQVIYRDSNCSSADGMNQAINLFIAKQVDVFLGPVCDYSVAPVARQTRFWNLPLISVGAMARDFTQYHLIDYPLLTRAGPVNFGSLSDFFLTTFRRFNWDKYFIIYDKIGQGEIVEDFCHLVSSSLHYDINEKAPQIMQDYYKIGRLDIEQDHMLPQQVGFQYSGKKTCTQMYLYGVRYFLLVYIIRFYYVFIQCPVVCENYVDLAFLLHCDKVLEGLLANIYLNNHKATRIIETLLKIYPCCRLLYI